ncbi:hypothetical protein CEK26_005766 [Fusarium fujikuroi]|nr:hypothetical protein CEK27_005770 [Fusarium fujikuroi]QGI78982.1 hypothetical protein CEK25_005711 [Fusarium fujikuroi]QGI92697.1 hypothetical protein CEK26_005766 [Fusarium fujikuroi]
MKQYTSATGFLSPSAYEPASSSITIAVAYKVLDRRDYFSTKARTSKFTTGAFYLTSLEQTCIQAPSGKVQVHHYQAPTFNRFAEKIVGVLSLLPSFILFPFISPFELCCPVAILRAAVCTSVSTHRRVSRTIF